MTSVFNGKIEKCTRSCHGKGKAQKLFTYLQVPSGAAVWHIINKLFIWRQTCFFDGGELKKRDALPYCVSKELWLEKSFVSAQEKRGDNSSVKHRQRDPRVLWGSLFAYRLVQLNYFPHDPLLYLLLLACEQPAEDRGASTSLWFTARIHFEVWNSGRGRQRCRFGVEGRS